VEVVACKKSQMDEKLFIQFWMIFLIKKIKEMKTLDEKYYIQSMDENLYTG